MLQPFWGGHCTHQLAPKHHHGYEVIPLRTAGQEGLQYHSPDLCASIPPRPCHLPSQSTATRAANWSSGHHSAQAHCRVKFLPGHGCRHANCCCLCQGLDSCRHPGGRPSAWRCTSNLWKCSCHPPVLHWLLTHSVAASPAADERHLHTGSCRCCPASQCHPEQAQLALPATPGC